MRKKFVDTLLIFIIIIVILLIYIVVIKSKNTYDNIQNKDLINYSDISIDSLWSYSFQNNWNELIRYLNVNKIEFLDNKITDNQVLLNQKYTNESIIDAKYIYTKMSKPYFNIKNDIIHDVKDKFNITTNLNNINSFNNNGLILYSILKKDLYFKNEFSYTRPSYFTDINGNTTQINVFGIKDDNKSIENIQSTYWVSSFEYGITLNTVSEDEIIFIMPKDINDSSINIWNDYIKNNQNYSFDFSIENQDLFIVPNVDLNISVNYTDICNREFKSNPSEYISSATQDIIFNLNKTGAYLTSESNVDTDSLSAIPNKAKCLAFLNPFVIFLKEKNCDEPYFYLKIYDNNFLEVIK